MSVLINLFFCIEWNLIHYLEVLGSFGIPRILIWVNYPCLQTNTNTLWSKKTSRVSWSFLHKFLIQPRPSSEFQNRKQKRRQSNAPINEVEALFQNIQDQFLFSTRKPEKSQPTRHHSWVLSWDDFQFVFCFHFIYSKNTFMLISNSRKVRKEFRTLM